MLPLLVKPILDKSLILPNAVKTLCKVISNNVGKPRGSVQAEPTRGRQYNVLNN
jgi:hypothetical protein